MTIVQNPPRSSHGCLWGCLAILALLFLPIIAMGGYGAWFLWQGFHRDPVLRTVAVLLDHDGMARQVLGDNIHVTGVTGDFLSFVPGLGAHNEYEVTLAGSKAAGTLDVEAESGHGQITVRSMILTGPGGARYDLMHNMVLSPGTGATAI
jgi:hypothetical protein